MALQLATIRGEVVIVDSADLLTPVIDLDEDGGDLLGLLARNLLRLSDRFLSVKAFGAVGDGVTDDTAAILATIAHAGENGGVYYPKGTYLVTQAVEFQRVFNLTLAGQSHIGEPGAILKLAAGAANGSAIFWSGAADQTFRGLTFDLNGISEGRGIGARTGCVRGKISGCTFKGNGSSSGIGIHMSGSPTDLGITANHFLGCAYGILSAQSTSPQHVLIADNILDGDGRPTGNAISIDSPNGNASDISIIGNVAYNWTSTQICIGFAHVVRGVIANNIIHQCSGAGIHVEDGSTDIAITGNKISECGGAGIEATYNTARPTKRITIVGNTVADCLTLAPVVGAIIISGSNPPEGVIVAHNTVDNCGLLTSVCHGIVLFANNSRVLGNVVTNTQGLAPGGIKTFVGNNNLIAQNRCYDDQAVKTQDWGCIVAGNQTNTQIYDNNFAGNAVAGIDESGIGGVLVNYLKDRNIEA